MKLTETMESILSNKKESTLRDALSFQFRAIQITTKGYCTLLPIAWPKTSGANI